MLRRKIGDRESVGTTGQGDRQSNRSGQRESEESGFNHSYRFRHILRLRARLHSLPENARIEPESGLLYIMVPKGAVVETSYELDQPGLVRIKLADQPLFVFMGDLRESAEPVDGLRIAAAAG